MPHGERLEAGTGGQARRRLAFLVRASALLAGSLDYEAALAEIARIAVPAIADRCAVDIVQPDGATRRLITVVGTSASERVDGERLATSAHALAMQVIAHGNPALFSNLIDANAAASVVDTPTRLPHMPQVRSAMIVPLIAHGHTYGALSFARTRRGRRYGPEELALAQELARQAALAIDRARLYAAERQARQAAERAADRTARLQEVTAALSDSLTPSQAADTVVNRGVAALGASAGSVTMLTADETELEVVAAIGYSEEILRAWRRFPISAPVPLAEAARTGQIIVLESAAARAEHYPGIISSFTQDSAWAAIPLVIDGRILGAMGLSFPISRAFTADERDFMLALAHQCAQALDRARLYAAERAARAAAEAAQGRLAFLAEASTILSASLDYDTILAHVAQLATPVLADWCVIDVVEDNNTIRRVATAHADSARQALVQRLRHFHPELAVPTPVIQVVQSGQTLLLDTVSPMLVEASSYAGEGIQIVRELGAHSSLIVPLRLREQILGAISLVVAESGWRYGPADIALAEELARRAAVAIDHARLYAEAQMAVRARDELLSIVSHDLQNPLTVITVQAEFLTRRLVRMATPDMAFVQEGLARIGGEGVKMRRLIGDLLDRARLQVGYALDLEHSRVDLVALVRQVAFERQQNTTMHSIRVEIEQPELSGQFDGVRLERVLDNLLSNAIKYSPHGGDIVVALARAQAEGGDYAIISVRDQGVGIPAEDLPHIFDRFTRAGNVVGRIGGTGIGLAIVRQIVEQHGGTITVASEGAQGSLFTVRLPIIDIT
jgi:K+-sensing histidine kinase KdpD